MACAATSLHAIPMPLVFLLFLVCFSVVDTAFKLQEKPSALKREHPALQEMKFKNFFLFFQTIFALLVPDTDPGTGSGSTTLPCILSLANPHAHHSTRDLCELTDYRILCSVFPVLCGPAGAPLYAGPV
jgi:hypothetical protein